jgi:hypothetical protein
VIQLHENYVVSWQVLIDGGKAVVGLRKSLQESPYCVSHLSCKIECFTLGNSAGRAHRMYTCVNLLPCDPAPLAQWQPAQPSLGPMALATEELGQEVTGVHCCNGLAPRRSYRGVSLIHWRRGRKSGGRSNKSEETRNGIRRLCSNE